MDTISLRSPLGSDNDGDPFPESGLDRDLPQLPEPAADPALAEQVREVNEIVRHLWNALHGLNDVGDADEAGSHLAAARSVVRDLRRMVQEGVEALPRDYARAEYAAVIAVYSLLR